MRRQDRPERRSRRADAILGRAGAAVPPSQCMPPSRPRAAALAALVSGAALLACGAGRNHAADAYWSGGTVDAPKQRENDDDPVNPNKKPPRQIGAPDDFSGSPTAAPAAKAATWFGVRHDLALAPSSSAKERCSCLAVEVGAASDPKFRWAAGASEVGADAVVVALSARGVSCPGGNADETKRRPSISAVDQEGNDVIVEVEELPAGRPLAAGAVIPKPQAGGRVYVKGRTAKVPYARAAGGARCKVY